MHWVGLVGILILFGCGGGTQTDTSSKTEIFDQSTTETETKTKEEKKITLDKPSLDNSQLDEEKKSTKEFTEPKSLTTENIPPTLEQTKTKGAETLLGESSPFQKLQEEVKDIVEPLYADIQAYYSYQKVLNSPEDMQKGLIGYFNEKINPNTRKGDIPALEKPLAESRDTFLSDFFYSFPKLPREVTKENLVYLNRKYFHSRELALTLFKVLASQDERFFDDFSKRLQDDLKNQEREVQQAYESKTIVDKSYPEKTEEERLGLTVQFAKDYHENKLQDMQERFLKKVELYRLMWPKDQFQQLVMEGAFYYLSYFWSFRKNALPQEDIALSADPKYRADLLRQVDLAPDISREEHQKTVIARWPKSPERKAMLTVFQTLYAEGVTDSIDKLKTGLLEFERNVGETDPSFLPSNGTQKDFEEFQNEAEQITKSPRPQQEARSLNIMGDDNEGNPIMPYSYKEDFFVSLVKILESSSQDEKNRVFAVTALGNMGEKAIPALIKALRDENSNVRGSAADVLGKMGEKAVTAIPALIKTLGDGEWKVRAFAVVALGKMREKAVAAIPALTKALDDGESKVRAFAVEALGKMGEKAIPALITALGDGNKEVRTFAAAALGEIGEKAIPALITALRDGNKEVRPYAAVVLGRMGEKAVAAIPDLIRALGDSDPEARSSAAAALGKMGEKAVDAIPALIKALRDSDIAVRMLAVDVLGKMGEKGQQALKEWKAKNK